jgi:nitroreductase
MNQHDNPVLQAIFQRRATRKFKSDPVSVEHINAIISAGRMAPSAINKQPWRFYVLHTPDRIRQISEIIRSSSKWQMMKIGLKEAVHALLNPSSFKLSDGIKFFNEEDPIFHKAAVAVVITAPKSSEWAALDIGMCAQNMMLAAHSLGLSTCPVGLAKFIENTDAMEQMGISNDETVHLAVIIGYADEAPELHERKTDNVKFVD